MSTRSYCGRENDGTASRCLECGQNSFNVPPSFRAAGTADDVRRVEGNRPSVNGRAEVRKERGMKNHILDIVIVLWVFSALEVTAGSIIITVNTNQSRPISPWIYGINEYQSIAGAPRNLTLNRAGGNRWTAYNWENNFSNAGSDWGPYINDDSLSRSSVPAEAVRSVIHADRSRSNASLITVQLQGYVSADKNGNVDAHIAKLKHALL